MDFGKEAQRIQAELKNEDLNHDSLTFITWLREAPTSELESQLRAKTITRETDTWEYAAIQRALEKRKRTSEVLK